MQFEWKERGSLKPQESKRLVWPCLSSNSTAHAQGIQKNFLLFENILIFINKILKFHANFSNNFHSIFWTCKLVIQNLYFCAQISANASKSAICCEKAVHMYPTPTNSNSYTNNMCSIQKWTNFVLVDTVGKR